MNKTTRFKKLLSRPGATLIPVVHDALTAKIAEKVGFEAVSVGGFAVAGVNFGLPDVGLIGLSEMAANIKNVVAATNLPVFADADGGYGNEINVAHTVKEFESVGVASLFLEDQRHPKRCGHLDGKEIIPTDEMVAKIKAAVSARTDPDFTICARTDAVAVEGFEAAIARAKDYIKAGADIIFVEAPVSLDQLGSIPKKLPDIPLLVNMLEGGKTPLCTKAELEKMGYKLIAHPVTTLFSAVAASMRALEYLKTNGHTQGLAADMIDFPQYKELVELNKYLGR